MIEKLKKNCFRYSYQGNTYLKGIVGGGGCTTVNNTQDLHVSRKLKKNSSLQVFPVFICMFFYVVGIFK